MKFAYHVVRLLDEVEQIMVEHSLDLERNREQLKSIRRGEWTLEQIQSHFDAKERSLDEAAVKDVLLRCLEAHFGSLENAIRRDPSAERLARDIRDVLDRHAVSA